MIWVGAIALVVAAVCGVLAYLAKRRLHAMITTETFTAKELETLRTAASDAAGQGTFRYRCEVTGTAQPGPGGALKSEISGTECVWHRHVITRKYWETRRDDDGNRRRVERQETMADTTVGPPFLVADGTGSTLVDPAGTRPEGVQKVVDRFERENQRQHKTELKIGNFSLSLPSTPREGTLGYRYEEWVLKPGARLYVLGEASDASGEICVGKPSESGPFIISTKNEQDLIQENRRNQKVLTVAGAVLAPLGVLFLVIGLFQ